MIHHTRFVYIKTQTIIMDNFHTNFSISYIWLKDKSQVDLNDISNKN